jgi:hypothetical protein
MAVKKAISTLIESQLPEFITSEYELFSKFVTKYYEQQELQGQPLDVISNLQTYADIDYYEKNLLRQKTTLAGNITDSATSITVADATSFPEENGYFKIDDEICFYKTRTNTTFEDVSRGVSGNTKLGDLYSSSNFVSTVATAHSGGSEVQNVSNLFLYALIKSFEAQYLGAFPEKYLKGEVDKRTLIKNIRKFYKAKGTDASVRFIFNTLVAGGEENTPTLYNPRDLTYKSSESDWVKGYALKAKVLSGNVNDLIGKVITQPSSGGVAFASATVDNVRFDSTVDGENIYNIFLAQETINGEFALTSKTELTKAIQSSDTKGDSIEVFSTLGWRRTGKLLIGTEVFTFSDKNITQFTINSRQTQGTYPVGTEVYEPIELSGEGVTLLAFGLVYNLNVVDGQPNASVGEKIQIGLPGFTTADPKIMDQQNNPRWKFTGTTQVSTPGYALIQQTLAGLSTDVSAIFEDEQYYYIASSGYPSYPILDGAQNAPTNVRDQKLLKLIRKSATRTTEIYETPKTEVGILVNGVRVYGYKDPSYVDFGRLQKIDVTVKGSKYTAPPFVLVDGVAGKAIANLSGEFVESITLLNPGLYSKTPRVEITSGRDAVVRAIVTLGKVTSLVIDNGGDYYSVPPTIIIRDKLGRGRFAEYKAVLTGGKITGYEVINEGEFYDQANIEVIVEPVGSGAQGSASIRRWFRNRFVNLESKLDTEYGYLFENYNSALEYGYGHVANPKSLRVALNDNLNSTFQEPSTKTHSPILGFAYDGNPIYGPFAHENPLDPQSPIVRMTSSYVQRTNRAEGPSTTTYPLGTFIDDYEYRHRSGSLDQNNGRYCVTPQFPNGTYAYFLTINSQQIPQYPYILGQNYYSLPIDSNYNSNLSQTDLPVNARRFFRPGTPPNGGNVIATINSVKNGSIDTVDITSSSGNFSVGSKLVFDNTGTGGFGAEAIVSSVKGKSVNWLESTETKATRLEVINPAYLFSGDTLSQPATGASGEVVGTVRNDTVVVLRNVQGTFDTTNTFSASIKVLNLFLDKSSSYAAGSILKLTDGAVAKVAFGEVLSTTADSNIVTVKVLPTADYDKDPSTPDDVATGTAPYYFETEENLADHYLASNNLGDTSGTRITGFRSLSDGLEPFDVNQLVALVETNEDHGVGLEDIVNVSINPSDTTKTTTYYVRKRIYQDLQLVPPSFATKVNYTGIGRLLTYNVGWDYTTGSYTNIPLTGGSGSGAKANIVVGSDGYVTSIQITDGGTGYKREDLLSVDDAELVRSGASQSTQRLIVYVDHVGVSREATQITVDDASRFAENDLVKIDDEIIKISSISGNRLTVERAQESTTAVDHYDNADAVLYNGRYNFDSNYQVNGSESVSYDPVTHKLFVVYPSTTNINTLQGITSFDSFFENSSPQRLVDISTATSPTNKFEFRRGLTGDYETNPVLEIQEYYKYVFDTSDSSLTGSYLDFSPSKSFNIIPVEKTESAILPGAAGAQITVKFGFGPTTATNNYSTKRPTEFSNYYYFDRNGLVESEDSYLKIIKDPLTGRKVVNYVTSNRFCYSLDKEPQYDGSGSITYTTSSAFSIGEINEVSITNIGDVYSKTPIVVGVYPTETYLAEATVLFDDFTKTITGIRIDNVGSNYSNPKIVVTDHNTGDKASFDAIVRNGEVVYATVKSKGKGYTAAPTVAIVESDVKLFPSGQDIGVPKNVSIVRNGASFHKDQTLYSNYTTPYVYALKNYPENAFEKGEIVTQTINGTEVARGIVAEWREGSNLLSIVNIQGFFRENFDVVSVRSKNSGTIFATYVTNFSLDIRSAYDNQGYYTSDRGRVGNSNQRLTDSFFYQDYSYVIKSRTSINVWRDLIKKTTHPAGMKLFGEVIIDPVASSEMPVESPKASHFTVVQLWDPNKNKITVENTRRTITQSIQRLEDYRAREGTGTVSVQEYNFQDLLAEELELDAAFDGVFNSNGQLVGTRTFNLVKKGTNTLVTPYNEQALIITIDGVIQEPGVSFTVNGSAITFAAPPLGETVVEGQRILAQKFLGKVFSFRDSALNGDVLKKVRNIYQRGGRWLDSANQIERNTDFIILETLGWFESTYSSVISNNTIPWNILEPKFRDDIRLVLEALSHDIRFGGNVKSIDYAETFVVKYDNYETYINAAISYAVRLAKLAIRNWDWIAVNASWGSGSDLVTVTDTSNIAIGAYVSAGSAFPRSSNIKVIEIVSDTQVRLSGNSIVASGIPPSGSAAPGNTYLNGTQSGDVTLPTGTGVVSPGDTYSIPPGTSLTAAPVFSGLNQITFTFSGTNNGTFYDGSNLINRNRDYIIDYAVNWAKATYPAINWTSKETKCRRDTGFLLDAVVKHLRYGGNYDIVEFAELYFIGSKLQYINDQLTETLATYDKVLNELCVLAIRQTLPGTTIYTNIQPFIDSEVIADPNQPECATVASALNTYYDIIDTIFNSGPTVVDRTYFNSNSTGNYTSTTPVTNLNIIPDNQLPSSECSDVISAVFVLEDNITLTVTGTTQTKSLPDYIDGETTIFDLYYEDGTAVNLPGPEDNLLVALNGVVQRNKFSPNEPAFDAYYIDRTKNPNQIVFDSPPIWDQDISAKTIGEPTAVEKFFAYNIGSYRRYTIDSTPVLEEGSSTKGPFLILSVDDGSVYNVDDQRFLVVLVNGVIQDYGSTAAYTISGPAITFSYPLRKEDVVDIRLLYGKEYEKIVTLYDHEPGSYLIEKTLTVSNGAGSVYQGYTAWWNSDKGYPSTYDNVFFYQELPNGYRKSLGKMVNFWTSGSNLEFRLRSNNTTIDPSLDIKVGIIFNPNGPAFTIDTTTNPCTLTTENVDAEGKTLLARESQSWFKNDVKNTRDSLKKKGFFKIAPGDRIKIDGEKTARTIKYVPGNIFAKEYREDQDVTADHYGSYGVTPYNDITRGAGLSITPIMESDGNGALRIARLDWNKPVIKSDGKLAESTAYQYDTPPQIEFVPRTANGGGARAAVVVSNGRVISVDLIYGGSGYTEAPKAVVTRNYKHIRDNDIEVSIIKLGVQSVFDNSIRVINSSVEPITLPPPLSAFITSTVLQSPVIIEREIEEHIWPDEELSDMPAGADQPGIVLRTRSTDRLVPIELEKLDVEKQITSIVTTAAPNVITVSTLSTERRQAVTVTVQRELDNTHLENKNYYAAGAFLQTDLPQGSTIVYIPDTSQFSSNGKLLVGDEVIYYPRKYDDRFIFCERAQDGTTDQFWVAGTFVRQLPDMVSVVPGGVNVIQSISSVQTNYLVDNRGAESLRTVQAEGGQVTLESSARTSILEIQPQIDVESISTITFRRDTTFEAGVIGIDPMVITHKETVVEQEQQINVVFDYSVRRESTALLLFTPPSGLLDFYQEEVFFTNPIETRNNGFVTLVSKDVTKRDLTVITIVNANEGLNQYQGEYTIGNLGSNIGNWTTVGYDDGHAGVSGWTIQHFDRYFASLTINDFVKRSNSNFTLSGQKWNLANPSHQNPVAISSVTGAVSTTPSILVQTTNYFDDAGYIFTSGGSTIQYTSKTNTSFEGCTLISGPDLVTVGDEIVPHSIN